MTDRPESDDERERLLLDAMLGKLTTYLRMCGYDAAYALDDGPDPGDDALLERAREENRTLVTRDERLARRAPDGVLVTTRAITDQLREFSSAGYAVELRGGPVRCSTCNGQVERVGTDEPVPEYAPDPGEQPLWRCLDCGQVYWKGSHWDDVAKRIDAKENERDGDEQQRDGGDETR
ncbi:hypothetical protein C499_16077 [Halogeometricum borinquense DSM 11551]|uniref:Uncharacterized conserved protein n=1 Tax=Halogeometricum borinquense (strain ATCC 700274 / DSM 11551 / JCM 10706 / KCTC 4070 / PR3) TaxID=469382 RepID=E4NRY4_HALBP|nr:Mut7-C RNAse domain-containing protein [Halogeometricum borinquense]ADQ68030.1 uncharacterized conserved protein [Halogeometricum borinquense DSM 11551]ELY24412.1 hypothetical protein C499_16077 [Halogeometricum borinquense DSM 11551]